MANWDEKDTEHTAAAHDAGSYDGKEKFGWVYSDEENSDEDEDSDEDSEGTRLSSSES